MDARSIEMYNQAFRDGKVKDYNIRVMVVGAYNVGKSTLTKRLLGKDVNICERKSTEGIDIQIECCKVSLTTGEWIIQEKNAEKYLRLQRLVKLLNEQVQKSEDKEQVPRGIENHDVSERHDNGLTQHDVSVKTKQNIDQEVGPTFSQPVKSPITILSPEASSEVASRENEKKDTVMEILQLVNENSDKLEKSMVEYAALGMWDFAGQYIFYTTHQTFLSYRAVYLLVIDLSQQIKSLIKDECFLDIEGMKLCQNHGK
ncbi:hypothetical protein CHS0354_007954 [Potamilus streckersoni]|uniref:G domain-containing protein n=1 Tax=Potamilus streckersoni TaxID=2493646 RepID=A0AAE0VSF7_9BIVA|nr:hypothetical protein CHS0354_007954 [Potamilus streckersoni]